MVSGKILFRIFPAKKSYTQRKPPAHCFSQRHDIRNDSVILESKKPAGSSYSRLYFIENKRDLFLVREPSEENKEIFPGRIYSRFSLQRFHDNACQRCACSFPPDIDDV